MERTIVIGGGVIGLSVAYHLAQRNAEDVILLERNQLSSGTTWHAAGIVGPLRATPNMTRLAMYASELFPHLESQTNQSTGYKRTGGYWLAREPERMDELHRIAALGSHFGLSVAIKNAADTQNDLPFLNLSDHCGSMAVAEDATVNPVDLCLAYAKAARLAGVDIRENTCVSKIIVESNRATGVQLQDGTLIHANNIALCCGAWSKSVAQQAGLALPLQAVEHMYVVTEPVANLPQPFPVLRDLDTGIYIKGDAGGKLILGGFEANAKCWNPMGLNANDAFVEFAEDWDQFTPFMESAMALMPQFSSIGIQHFMNGPESFTFDTRPLLGQAPTVDHLYVAAGMNSVGVMSSAGIGRALADWIVDGSAPMDLWEVDVARADPKAANESYMQSRMKEAVSDQFAMHWPFKQASAGRDLRTSCLHDRWQACGAVFGSTANWERGLWYAKNEAERNLPYSIGQQAWQPIAEREAQAMSDGTVLLDLTPFSKFDVYGPDALAFIDHIACSNLDRPIGKVTYTALLNASGGIEADVTISRYAEDHFRVTSGAATRWRDMALLTRASRPYSVSVNDVTENEAVIGVMGFAAPAMMATLTQTDMRNFAYATTQQISIGGTTLRATRTSFVGEAGWELNMPNQAAGSIFDALTNAGAKPMGHYALESCRIEKGFRHWGHDIGPQITPLQAGLGFLIAWDKHFIGKSALLRQKEQGITKRLCLFSIEGQPLMLHDEPIIEAGKVVGLTTSGTRGVRTHLTLAFGLIDVPAEQSLQDTSNRQFDILVAGKRFSAQVLGKPPFDPNGTRMRA